MSTRDKARVANGFPTKERVGNNFPIVAPRSARPAQLPGLPRGARCHCKTGSLICGLTPAATCCRRFAAGPEPPSQFLTALPNEAVRVRPCAIIGAALLRLDFRNGLVSQGCALGFHRDDSAGLDRRTARIPLRHNEIGSLFPTRSLHHLSQQTRLRRAVRKHASGSATEAASWRRI